MIDLTFGDPLLLREILGNFHTLSEANLGYRMDDECEKNIIEWVRNHYKTNLGQNYKHIVLTHGANGALQILVNTLKNRYSTFVIKDMAFGWYDRILDMEKVFCKKVEYIESYKYPTEAMYIIDSPSNPFGLLIKDNIQYSGEVVWDSVYASPIFINNAMNSSLSAPRHQIMIGSFSKIFGLPGLRIGWIGTNEDDLAKKVYSNSLTAYCGLSTPSLEISNNLIRDIDLQKFEKIANTYLNYSREKFAKLKNIFDLDAPINGMFYMGRLDKSNKKLLTKAKVSGLPLRSILGEDFIRFNMADSPKNTENAVKAILKADKIVR